MADYSLVPVDYLPEFEGVSLVPVDHDPFADEVNRRAPPKILAEPQSLTEGDHSETGVPTADDFRQMPEAGSQMTGSIIPVCTFSSKQEHAGIGFTTCNYRCFGGGDTSRTHPFGTICPGVIPMTGG